MHITVAAKQLPYEVECKYVIAEQVLIQLRTDKALKSDRNL